ncbi:hypothetical protein RFI_16685 [Reticulomyxa filosa]|uniref:Dynein heavy chain tail domain-containing protein n=1 Tax=Reticulomyxa filosa TaxID=46433 RepID=X6N3P4_RETFI|nr:hypothetical protein RFI_16685 [Reticulomyxa filosa]|eukprot:ETO20533.1 hypothetical protein RFI_16685 [Reticulomyxa filosa]
MNKLSSQLGNAIQQVHGDTRLPIPKLPIVLTADNIKECASNMNILALLETALDDWCNIIQSIILQCQESLKNNCNIFKITISFFKYCLKKKRKRNGGKNALYPRKSVIYGHITAEGPLSEITFWRTRYGMLSGLWEQLTTHDFRNMVKVLEYSNTTKVQLFSMHLKELFHLYTESKDNVKFLSTLERHFKNIESGDLLTMIETIPSMLNALRMGRKNGTLMDLIAVEISESVARKINIRTIFNHVPEKVMQLVDNAKRVLHLWYMTINLRAFVFILTTYTAKICNDLYKVAEVLAQFNKFLGPRLKEITKDSKEIDQLTYKVDLLKKPFVNLSFSTFDRRYNNNWEQIMKSFWDEVNEIEERSKTLIDTSFQKLRSAEGAFNLLQDFKNIECRKSIQQQMMLKFSDILVHYRKEIDLIKSIFDNNKLNPPVSKDQPPIAGAISWSRSLYAKIKHVVIRFQEAKDLYNSPEFQVVKDHYLGVAKEIVQFEEDLIDMKKKDKITILCVYNSIKYFTTECGRKSPENQCIDRYKENSYGGDNPNGSNSGTKMQSQLLRTQTHCRTTSQLSSAIFRMSVSKVASINNSKQEGIASFVNVTRSKISRSGGSVWKDAFLSNNNRKTSANDTNSSLTNHQLTLSSDLSKIEQTSWQERRLEPVLSIKSKKNLPEKILTGDLRAIEVNGEKHLPPELNDLLFNFTDAVLLLNYREHMIIKNCNKFYEVVRECIFEWMTIHKQTDAKLNPPCNSLAHHIEETLEEWMTLTQMLEMKVNFAPELFEIVRESKYLDRMGFEICDSAMKILLQEQKFITAIDKLQEMLDSYELVCEPLQFYERCAVRRCFKNLLAFFRPGFIHLNWNSLGISTFIETCIKAIQDFNVHKNVLYFFNKLKN